MSKQWSGSSKQQSLTSSVDQQRETLHRYFKTFRAVHWISTVFPAQPLGDVCSGNPKVECEAISIQFDAIRLKKQWIVQLRKTKNDLIRAVKVSPTTINEHPHKSYKLRKRKRWWSESKLVRQWMEINGLSRQMPVEIHWNHKKTMDFFGQCLWKSIRSMKTMDFQRKYHWKSIEIHEN